MARDSKRYLGLELAGAKNQKTSLAVLEYYPKEGKTFLLDIHEKISGKGYEQSHGHSHTAINPDEALLQLIHEFSSGVTRMGVNVPLELPPCLFCTKRGCKPGGKCSSPPVKWMRDITRKAARNPQLKALDFTPYTQRPIELWIRYQVLPKLYPHERFEIDETLGGNKAPLTARMTFLKRHLGSLHLSEVWPKLTIGTIAESLGLNKRTISSYRKLEEGVHAREEILETLTEKKNIFIYEKDIRRIAASLSCFDAFLCAYTALLSDLNATQAPPHGFPLSTGWVEYPIITHR